MTRLLAALTRQQAEHERSHAPLRRVYDLEARELRRSLVHRSPDDNTLVTVRQFVTIAQAVGDPLELLDYFRPLLEFLELNAHEEKDLRAMGRAATRMAAAAERAGLSKRQVGRLRRYAEALALVNGSQACIAAMERTCEAIEATVARGEDITSAEERDLERALQRLDAYGAQHRQYRQDVRRALQPPRVHGRARTARPQRSRRKPRRPAARRTQSDSGGGDGADGDGDPEPPELTSAAARAPGVP